MFVIFQGHQYQKDKVSPNLLQKAKKSLTSSFESFMNKRVRRILLCNRFFKTMIGIRDIDNFLVFKRFRKAYTCYS